MKEKIIINLERFGETGLIGEVESMDDSERGMGTLVLNKNNRVIKSIGSLCYPELVIDTLYIGGKDIDKDNNIFTYRFKDEETREQAIEDINSLVDEYNGQIVKKPFSHSKEYERQVKMNELLMDMAIWQYENDEPIDPNNKDLYYHISIGTPRNGVIWEVESCYSFKPLGVVLFTKREKAKKCAELFEDKILEICQQPTTLKG